MFLSVDISDFVEQLFWALFAFMHNYLTSIDSIIILHRQGFSISLLDFLIGIIVVSIVLGAFLHISKPDKFYADRR